jgi:hypothetical protein
VRERANGRRCRRVAAFPSWKTTCARAWTNTYCPASMPRRQHTGSCYRSWGSVRHNRGQERQQGRLRGQVCRAGRRRAPCKKKKKKKKGKSEQTINAPPTGPANWHPARSAWKTASSRRQPRWRPSTCGARCDCCLFYCGGGTLSGGTCGRARGVAPGLRPLRSLSFPPLDN